MISLTSDYDSPYIISCALKMFMDISHDLLRY